MNDFGSALVGEFLRRALPCIAVVVIIILVVGVAVGAWLF